MRPIYLDDSSDDELEKGEYNLSKSFDDFCLTGQIGDFDRGLASFSFASHALGIAILNNDESRKIYRGHNRVLMGIDNQSKRREEFEEYIRVSIERTISNLVDKVCEHDGDDDSVRSDSEGSVLGLEDSGVKDSIYGAHGRILTYLKDMCKALSGEAIIEETVANCLNDSFFYKKLSNKGIVGVLQHFEEFIDCLSVNLGNDLESNAADLGSDSEVKFFKLWDSVVTRNVVAEELIKTLSLLKPPREVLESNVRLENPDSKTFLKNILLSNRSDKRRLKNLKDFDLYQTGEDETYRSWFFPPVNQFGLERSVISRGTQNRQSWVSNLESYDNVAKAINNIKKNLQEKYGVGVSDKLIAQAVRNNINGEEPNLGYGYNLLESDKKQFNQLIASLSQLFFGVESMRNPGSFVVNQMMLDLIIDHGYSFQQMLTRTKDLTVDAFVGSSYETPDCLEEEWSFACHIFPESEISNRRSGGMMPMSHTGVMAIARRLEDKFHHGASRFMPKPYKYKGSLSVDSDTKSVNNIEQLMRLEGKMVDAWLTNAVYPELEHSPEELAALSVKQKIQILESSIKENARNKWYKGTYIDHVKFMQSGSVVL